MGPSTPVAARSETADRILDAAYRSVESLGLGRTTVEDVARTAGLTRQTIYRYFPSKDHLIAALVLREAERLLEGVREAFAAAPDLHGALYEGVLHCLRFARSHPLLDRLLATDAETLVPHLTTRGAPLLRRGREVVVRLMQQKAWVSAGLVEEAADALVRTVISHALTRSDHRPERVARDLARIFTTALTAKEASRA